ncbi:MAG TPA: CBS domain-containing protein [Longimicrobium sp.]|nr:CBS domain-containing protein [Longimicrobium sp.]
MARYGRDYGRDRWSGGGGYGQSGYGGSNFGTGGGSSRGGEYGGMGSDANYGGGGQYNAGRSGFGTGGGTYDNDFNAGGYGGYGYGGTSGGGMNRGGYGGGSQEYGGYGADSGFSGGYGGGQSDWSRGSQQRGGFGYGSGGGQGGSGGSGYGGGGYAGGSGYGGGAGYTGGGQGYGGYGTGSDMGGGQSFGSTGFGASTYSGQQDETRRLRAADVMTDNPECVTPETSLAEAARKMRDLDVGIIPVVESESSKRLRGVLTDRDIAIRAVADGKDANTTRVMEVMTTQVETCNKNDSLRDVLSVMEREQVRRVPITDREGRLVGIIAQADVATEVDTPQGQRHFADTLESISEPGNPRGARWGGRASQGRGGGGGGIMGAVRSAVSNLGGSGQRESSYRGTNPGGMNASGGSTTGNNDPRAMNDPGSENV